MALLELSLAAVVLMLCAHYGVIAYALYHRREVKVGLKIPFAAFFFEAKDHQDSPQPTGRQISGKLR